MFNKIIDSIPSGGYTIYKINSDCSIRKNRSWTFEIPKNVAAMADTAATVPMPLSKSVLLYIATVDR